MIDAHVHVACADERYDRVPLGVGSDWSCAGGGAAALLDALDAAGVERAVVVQAIGVYGYDCSCAIDVVAASPDRFALVVAVDMEADDPAGALGALAEQTAIAGVRAFGVGRAGTGWLTDGRGAAVWQLAAELGVVVVPTIFTEWLPQLRDLIEASPTTIVALDHCAFPDMAEPARRHDLLALADLPALHLKVTSHNLDAPDDPADFLGPLAEAFGAERLAWGSDHPQHQTLAYDEMVALARRAARHLEPSQQAAFLDGTGRRLWFSDSR